MLIDREAVIQQLTDGGVLEHDGCGVFIASGDASELITAVMQIAQRAAEQEREACAALCEERYYGDTGELNHELAEAIRARTKGKS